MNLQPTQRKANSNTAVFIKSNELILDKDASILGKGGFGIVQLGIFKGERVAIKSMDLKDGKIDALSRTHLFIREAKKMLGLRHERIVAFKGFVIETMSLVMEYMSEGSLKEYIEMHASIQWIQRYQFAKDIAEGMAYLHSKSDISGKQKADVFHQDLKSDNVLLCKDLETPLRSGIVLFRAKISDFGLSIVREIEEPFKRKKPNLNASKDGNGVEDGDVPYYRDLSSKQSRLQKQLVRDMATNNENISLEIAVNLTRDRATTIQQAVSPTYCTSANFSVLSAVVLNGGTKVYMAPELKNAKQFTKAADVYAFGVILLELVTLEDPSVSLKYFLGRLDQMSIPGFYKQMIHDCLNINANERPRFKHLNEFLSSLEYTNAANNLLKAEEKNSKPIYGHDLRVDSSSSWASDSKTEKYTSRAFNYRNQKSKPVFRPNSITSSNMRRRSKRNRLVVSLSALILFLLVAIITILALFFTNRFGNTGNISSSLSTETISVNSTNSTNNISTDNSSSSISSRFQAPWSVGVHSFDLFSYSDDIQQIVLNELKKTNVTVIRIHIQQTFRGDYVQSDVEVGYLGNYDDNILYRIDKFMVKVQHSGMKLIIALHDRWQIGCYGSDLYQTTFGIPWTLNCLETPNAPDKFYNLPASIKYFDDRIAHILNHKNALLGNQPWGSLSEVIYAFDIQSQAEYKLSSSYNLVNSWMCDRATKMKQHIANGVLISTGATGSIDLATRMNNYMCSAIDIIALGDMEVDSNASWDLFEAKFRQAVVNGTIYNKTVILEHFNSCGYRPSKYASLAESLGIAWMIWGVTYNVKTPDCDFYTSTPSLWDLLG